MFRDQTDHPVLHLRRSSQLRRERETEWSDPTSIDCFFAPPRRKRFIFPPRAKEDENGRHELIHSIPFPVKRRLAPPNAARRIWMMRLRTRSPGRKPRQTGARATATDGTDTAGNNSGSRHIRRMDGRTDGPQSVSNGAELVEGGRERDLNNFTRRLTDNNLTRRELTMPIEDFSQ